MKSTTRLGLVAIGVAAAALAAFAYGGRKQPTTKVQGWIEGHSIFVSPDETGRVETLSVREGDQVQTGQQLFSLDQELQRAAVNEADAALANAKVSFDRAKELLKKAVGSQKTYDDAEAALRTAEARLASARTRLDRRKVASPVTGTVQEVYFRQGEMVQSGRPIVSLLPPGNTRVRFFVPQAMVPRLKIGDAIGIGCDGCAAGLTGKINFVSAQAEFTPPVIYSQEERARLVFRIEAIPDTPEKVRVGQPVTVTLKPDGAEANGRR